MNQHSAPAGIIVAAMYRFFDFPGYQSFRAPLLDFCVAHKLKGTLLLAPEGINGTVAGRRENIDALKDHLQQDDRFEAMEYKESRAVEMPFQRMKVKLKKEIVTMGLEGVQPGRRSGQRLDPEAWNRVISDPGTLVIDTRNRYEYDIGTFVNAVSPDTVNFREFPEFVKTRLDPARHRKVAMFCTGGIRCEKASAWMLEQGFEEVYQLNGGILRYLEEVKPEQSLWRGECFVFDGRVAVDEKLEQGNYEQCFACRRPLSTEDLQSPYYERGVSCPACHEDITAKQRRRFSERQKQVEIAERRGSRHIGVPQQGKP